MVGVPEKSHGLPEAGGNGARGEMARTEQLQPGADMPVFCDLKKGVLEGKPCGVWSVMPQTSQGKDAMRG